MIRLTRISAAAALAAVFGLPLLAQDEEKKEPAKPAPLTVPAEGEGEEKPAGEESPADEKKPNTAIAVAQWKLLADRKLEIFNTLQKLKKTFEATTVNSVKRKIRGEFQELIIEFETEIHPEMIELADAAWAGDKTLLAAGEIVLRDAFNANQFDVARDTANALLAGNRRTREIYSMAFTSEFNTHGFEKAKELVGQFTTQFKPSSAEKGYYDDYMKTCEKYVNLWKTEQEIRAKEAALEGDMALPRVQLETTQGTIILELFENEAPNTVASFIQTVEAGEYDGVSFHRYIPNFMIQTGDPETRIETAPSLPDETEPKEETKPKAEGEKKEEGEKAEGEPEDEGKEKKEEKWVIECECYKEGARMHFQGSLSMAHRGKDTGGRQFFLTHMPSHWLNWEQDKEKDNHTVFGRVVSGMEVVRAARQDVDRITKATVIRKRPHEYKAVRKPEEAEIDGTLEPKEGDGEGKEKPGETTPEKTEPEKTTPEKTTPEKTTPKKTIPESPEKTEPAKPGPAKPESTTPESSDE